MTQAAEQDFRFSDYWQVLKRRGLLFLGTLAAVVLVGCWFAFRTPTLYQSTGVLLAEQPEVPEHVVRSTVPNYPEERVRVITQRVMTPDNLYRIVSQYDLYPSLTEDQRSEALREFRSHLRLSSEDPQLLADLLGSGAAAQATAFSVSFAHPSPIVARDVASAVMTLYLQENQRARREQAAATMRFLTQEASQLEERIREQEARLAQFKRENAGSLPELTDMNFQLLDRTQRDVEQMEQTIRSLRERQALYSSELAQLSPHATVMDTEGAPVLGPQDRLKMLQRTYMRLISIYSEGHPDVLRVRREIEALSESTGLQGFDRDTLRAELATREDQLAAARDRYSADHPDVLRLERTVAGLREAVAAAPRARAALPSPPDNPAYIQRQVQLQATESELAAAIARRDQLRERLTELEGRLTVSPEVEREFNNLNRGHAQTLAQYDEVQRKLGEAQMALNLETDGTGERFTVLASPTVPSSPSQPNRLAILLLTMVSAFGLAGASVAVAEATDTTVRNSRDVLQHLEIPPLVAVPFIYTPADLRRRNRRRFAAVTASLVWLGLISLMITFPVG